MTKPIPRFKHNCNFCTFIGSKGRYDIWIHRISNTGNSIIARYGNKQQEYTNDEGHIITSGRCFRQEPNQPVNELYWTNAAAAVIAKWILEHGPGQ